MVPYSADGLLCIDASAEKKPKISKRVFIIITAVSIVLAGARLVSNRYFDGTIFYDRIIARWSFSIIAIWLIVVQVYICKSKWAEKIVKSKP